MNLSELSDVFSLSDHLLAERLQFVKEIGFGNWGSVWLCRPKSSSGKPKDIDVAVKLVHRSKTSTAAARVRSLWNEMKIVRSFKDDSHPSIVPFHSFIITPSFALITMAHLPTPIPVEVSELRAKEWFRSLLSGVRFLHSRGVVHNDIKPANILLSRSNVPVFVDFGFAEKYDLSSPKAFHSNLTYGTPEYLSPERARGRPHDTRRSDVWSLGITFFEILVGRTPFEHGEGEVFEKKEDLERYWNRTMRGKWVGKYSISQPVERFLKRMIVPNADLRCTAAEMMGDVYWDATPATSAYRHRKSVSAAVPSGVRARTHSFLDSVRSSFKDKEEGDKEPSPSRLDTWSPSRSMPQSSASRPASRTESTSRSALRMGATSRPTSREEFTSRVASAVLSASPSQAPIVSNRRAIVGHPSISASPVVRARTHSRSQSQPKLRTPGVSATARARKLSTVQASPMIKPQLQIGMETEFDEAKDTGVCGGRGSVKARPAQTLISLNSDSLLRRPMLSPRVLSVSGPRKNTLIPSGQVDTTEKKHTPSHHAHLQTLEVDHKRARAPYRLPTPLSIPQTPMPNVPSKVPIQTARTSHPASVLHLSGKPHRNRRRPGVLVDLTGFARNVDLGAHGVGRSVRHGGSKKDRVKENTRGRITVQENKENEGLVRASRKDACVPNKLSGASPLSPKTSGKEQATPPILPAAHSTTKATKGSVRDRMIDWERERERLREMDRLADTCADGHSTILTRTSTGSNYSDNDDSRVEAEVVAEVASAQAKCRISDRDELQKATSASIEGKRPSTMQTVTTISSTSSNWERSQIEVARVGVRTSAQMLAPRNGSITALGLGQSAEKRPSEECRIKINSVADIGLPVDVNKNGESGFSSLKHSVKASIDKGMRFYKSSTLGQLTGRNTPVWCASPEPIDFEQRRSGEEGRFSWENIRPEHEIAMDRMNMWIQSVEKVVEETCQNFASTSVTPPALLPLVPISRSSSGVLSAPTLAAQDSNNNPKNNTFNTRRSPCLPRRPLAANEIFAESADPNAPLSPASPPRGADAGTSSSYVRAGESSVPALPTINLLLQTPRRRRATISTGSPTHTRAGPAASDVFDGTPSKRREKSKSHSNLDKHIKDIARLELELNMAPASSPLKRLSAVLDRSLFVAPPVSPRLTEDSAVTPGTTCGRSDDPSASPYNVEPYKSSEQVTLESPNKRHLEGVYDRFLMAASGVKRVGKCYQSDNSKSVHDITSSTAEQHTKAGPARSFNVFGAGRRAMPPAVSSEDAWRRSASIDELGFITVSRSIHSSVSVSREAKSTFVRRAIKAIVPGRTISRRMSRTIVA